MHPAAVPGNGAAGGETPVVTQRCRRHGCELYKQYSSKSRAWLPTERSNFQLKTDEGNYDDLEAAARSPGSLSHGLLEWRQPAS